MCMNHAGRLLKCRLSVGLRWRLRFCILSRFPGDADATWSLEWEVPRTMILHLGPHCPLETLGNAWTYLCLLQHGQNLGVEGRVLLVPGELEVGGAATYPAMYRTAPCITKNYMIQTKKKPQKTKTQYY